MIFLQVLILYKLLLFLSFLFFSDIKKLRLYYNLAHHIEKLLEQG